MSLRSRWRFGRSSTNVRSAKRATVAHFTDFVRSHAGVEAYLEPATRDTPTTVILIATTGQWTRRAVPDPDSGWAVARSLGVPVYDVQRTGYPRRMREWNSRQRQS